MYYQNVIDVDYHLISWKDRMKLAYKDLPKVRMVFIYIIYLCQAGMV